MGLDLKKGKRKALGIPRAIVKIFYFLNIAMIHSGSGVFISLSNAISSIIPCTAVQKHLASNVA